MMKHVSLWLKKFKQNESGSVSVEMILMTPLLVWVFIATLTYFDAYRAKFGAQKANTILADLASRELVTLDSGYVDGMLGLFDSIAYRNDDPGLRVSVLEYDGDNDKHEVVWSEVRGSGPSVLTSTDAEGMGDTLPVMANRGKVIVVETWSDYSPRYGDILVPILSKFEIQTYSFISPRFASTICYRANDSADLSC